MVLSLNLPLFRTGSRFPSLDLKKKITLQHRFTLTCISLRHGTYLMCFNPLQLFLLIVILSHLWQVGAFSHSVLNPFDMTLLVFDGFLALTRCFLFLTRCLYAETFQACHLSCPDLESAISPRLPGFF